MNSSLCQEIKQKISVKDFAERELKLKIQNGRSISFLGGTNLTETIYGDTHFYCFKTGLTGSVIDLCAHSKFNGDIGQAIRYLATYCQISLNEDPVWIDYTQNLCNQIQKWHEELSEDHKKYLEKRKIKEETIKRLKLGTNKEGRLVVPYFKNSYISYYITRGENPKYKKAPIDEYNQNTLWGLHTLNRNNKELYITEGAFDAISLDQEGFSVISSMGGYFNKDQKEHLKSIFSMFDLVYAAFDSDSAGKLFLENITEVFLQNKIKFNVIKDYKDSKDISEYYERGGNLKELASKSLDGIHNMITGDETEEELHTILVRVCRYLNRLEIASLFIHINKLDRWNSEYIKELIKQCQASPSEHDICKVLSSKKKLKYSEGLGFFEYSSGHWQSINETTIKGYIGDELGKYRTGSKLHAITTLVKSENNYTDLFNTMPYMNFSNGVLDLDSGILHEHSPSFLLSHQVDYAYNEKSECKEWEKFILDVSAQDILKAKLLQETVGYILFPDNRLQKAFFLIGEGANGKSVFLNIISKLFDRKAISNIEMCGLAESFQRIRLANSVLNIASESHTSFEEGELAFKQAVVGDTINGCFKNRDFVEFKPRTKFFTACNRFINAKDTSEGFLRRICFIKFSVKFVDQPKSKNEMIVDKKISDRLEQELPGIFNWAYEGYKRLKQQMCFTQLPEQDMVMEDYMKLIDPMFAFLSESMEISPSNITFFDRDTLFEKYKMWCSSCNHYPAAKNKFIQSLRYTSSMRSLRIYEQSHLGKRGFLIEKVI